MSSPSKSLRPVLRILTLRGRAADYEQLSSAHLLLGLGATWLVGIGRYWDNPRVSLCSSTPGSVRWSTSSC